MMRYDRRAEKRAVRQEGLGRVVGDRISAAVFDCAVSDVTLVWGGIKAGSHRFGWRARKAEKYLADRARNPATIGSCPD